MDSRDVGQVGAVPDTYCPMLRQHIPIPMPQILDFIVQINQPQLPALNLDPNPANILHHPDLHQPTQGPLTVRQVIQPITLPFHLALTLTLRALGQEQRREPRKPGE